ncbi:MAG: hypothetical protein AB7O49_10110 [Sphingomonadales bacterium]
MTEPEDIEVASIRQHETHVVRVLLRTFDDRLLLVVQSGRRDGLVIHPTSKEIAARHGTWKRVLPQISSALDLMEAQAKDEGGPTL